MPKAAINRDRLEEIYRCVYATSKYLYFFVAPDSFSNLSHGLEEFTQHGYFVKSKVLKRGKRAFRIPAKYGWPLRRIIFERIKGRSKDKSVSSNRDVFLATQNHFYTKSDLEAIWKIQDGKCYYTGKLLGRSFRSAKFHVDHIVPLCNGGVDAPWNLALCTARINVRKSGKDRETFLDELEISALDRERIKYVDLGRRLYFKDVCRDKRKKCSRPEVLAKNDLATRFRLWKLRIS